jgi:hypothetical protein
MQMIQSTLSKLMDEAQQPVPLSYSAAMENTEDVTHAEQRWKRLTSLVRITLMHAETGLIIVHQETMRNRLEQKALVAYEKARDPLAMAKKQPEAWDTYPQQEPPFSTGVGQDPPVVPSCGNVRPKRQSLSTLGNLLGVWQSLGSCVGGVWRVVRSSHTTPGPQAGPESGQLRQPMPTTLSRPLAARS